MVNKLKRINFSLVQYLWKMKERQKKLNHKGTIVTQKLSQDEIDLILNSIPINKGDDKNRNMMNDFSVKPYNFKNPDQLSKSARRTLERIHFTFAKHLGYFLNDNLRMNVQVNYISNAHMSDTEYVESLPNPSCLYTFPVEKYDKNILFEIQPQLVYFLVDRLLGGPGKLIEINRELTAIEQRILERLLEELIVQFKSAWSIVEDLSISVGSYYSNPNFVQLVDSGESVVSISLEVNFAENVTLFNIAYPYYLINELLEKLETEQIEISQVNSAKERRILKKNLEHTFVPIAVNLGETRLSFQELMNLREGDVLFLDQKTTDLLPLYVGDRPKYFGRAGIMKKRLAFKVVKPIR